MSKLLNFLLTPCLLVLVLAASATAQSSTATLSGTVEDERGALIPGAAITVKNYATSLERHATTNDSGSFTIPLLPPGEYTVLVEREGFTRVQLTNIVLNVGDQKAVQVQLKVGDVKSEVLVTADASLIRTDGSVGTVIDQQFVKNIPLNGRSFQALLELTPGVTIAPSSGTSGNNPGQFSVNGQRTNANYFTVDGVSANAGISAENSAFPGTTAAGQVPTLTASGTTAALVSADSLQEFRIQTSSYSAEFGRQPGGQVQLVTKSGGNDFHGTAYNYVRNEALDANNWFNNANKLKRPPLRQQLFGGTFSGPIFLPRFGEGGRRIYSGKNRTFFFFSYEGLRLLLPRAGQTTVPSLCFRGELSQCTNGQTAAPSQFWPILQAMPKPTGTPVLNAQGQPTGWATYAFSYGDPSSYDATTIKIDHTVGKVTFFGRYAHTPSDSKTRQSGFAIQAVTAQKNESITTGSTWMMSTNVLNEVRFNYTTNFSPSLQDADDLGGAVPLRTFGFVGASPTTSRLSISGSGLPGPLVVGWGTSIGYKQRQTNIVDNLSVSLGDHRFKFGVDFRRSNPLLDSRSGITFESVIIASGSFTPGNPQFGRLSSYQINYNTRTGISAAAFDNLSLYAQDDWKINPRLTLTYGLRWELVPPPHTTSGPAIPVFTGLNDPRGPAGIGIAPSGTPFWKTRYTNFAPRVGASYVLFDRPGRELAIRGGFGMFYDLGAGFAANNYAIAFPFQTTVRYPEVGHADPACRTTTPASGVAFPLPACALVPSTTVLGPPAHYAMDPELVLPRTFQWNVSAEQSLGTHQVVTISYVGAKGRELIKNDLIRGIRIIGVPYSTPTATTEFNIQRNGGYSDYRSLQLQYRRRLAEGFSAIANYTLGYSRDTDSSELGIAVPSSAIPPSFHYGYSIYDVRHNVSVASTYEIPGFKGNGFIARVTNGWGLDVMFRKRSGFPLNVTYNATLPSLPGIYALQADFVPGQPFWIDDPGAPGGQRLNIAAFRTPTVAGTVGNLPRNAVRGFGAKQVDVSLRRDFRFREKISVQLRVDAFNLFNWPNFTDPFGDMSNSATFGRTFSTLNIGLRGLNGLYQVGGPRSLQGMARISF